MQQHKVVGKNILLADDQSGVRKAVKFLLQLDQHRVTEAGNGREAYELFLRDSFDLVITDFAMPGMSGDELASHIKRLMPQQPILMITAYAREVQAGNDPVDAVLNKPFSFPELRQAIAELLDRMGKG